MPTGIKSKGSLSQRLVASANNAAAIDDTLLARILFQSQDPASPRQYPCELPVISPETGCEDWCFSTGSVDCGVSDEICWSSSELFTFAAVHLNVAGETDICALTHYAYLALLGFVECSPHRHLLRCWNYMPHINRGEGESEIYKQFCAGRLKAFQQSGMKDEHFPAASAVGHKGDYLTIHLLAGFDAGTHHGNKNQVHAFQYPRQYGVSSPSFARATSFNGAGTELLFVSGTASIIGHATLHPNELEGQLRVTIENIRTLLRQTGKSPVDVRGMRVYLRDPNDYAAARNALSAEFADCDKVFLEADICRSDLMVEVECFCT